MSSARRTPVLVLALALGVLVVLVASGVLDQADVWVENALPPVHSTGLVGTSQRLASRLADWANPRLVAPVTVLAALRLGRRGRPEAPRTVIPAVLAASVAVLALKAALARPGPRGSSPVDVLGWWPSGHTTTALVCAGALAALGGRRWAWAAGAWTLLVGFAMVWAHGHWVSDVVGGAVLGGLVLALMLPRRPRPATVPEDPEEALVSSTP